MITLSRSTRAHRATMFRALREAAERGDVPTGVLAEFAGQCQQLTDNAGINPPTAGMRWLDDCAPTPDEVAAAAVLASDDDDDGDTMPTSCPYKILARERRPAASTDAAGGAAAGVDSDDDGSATMATTDPYAEVTA